MSLQSWFEMMHSCLISNFFFFFFKICIWCFIYPLFSSLIMFIYDVLCDVSSIYFLHTYHVYLYVMFHLSTFFTLLMFIYDVLCLYFVPHSYCFQALHSLSTIERYDKCIRSTLRKFDLVKDATFKMVKIPLPYLLRLYCGDYLFVFKMLMLVMYHMPVLRMLFMFKMLIISYVPSTNHAYLISLSSQVASCLNVCPW